MTREEHLENALAACIIEMRSITNNTPHFYSVLQKAIETIYEHGKPRTSAGDISAGTQESATPQAAELIQRKKEKPLLPDLSQEKKRQPKLPPLNREPG